VIISKSQSDNREQEEAGRPREFPSKEEEEQQRDKLPPPPLLLRGELVRLERTREREGVRVKEAVGCRLVPILGLPCKLDNSAADLPFVHLVVVVLVVVLVTEEEEEEEEEEAAVVAVDGEGEQEAEEKEDAKEAAKASSFS